ncbi:MAG: NAD(P)/FAD-dependent oxidoreductase [Bacteroidota bacterium]
MTVKRIHRPDLGVAVQNAEVKIAGSKFSSRGPVLITHWGLSGPGVIRLSAWAAHYLHEITTGSRRLSTGTEKKRKSR